MSEPKITFAQVRNIESVYRQRDWAFAQERAADIDAQAVLAWCGERLAGYKKPRLVRFIDALPRTASVKVRKDVLRQGIEVESAGS